MEEEQSVEIILKLFDQVKSSSDKTDREIESISTAVKDLTNNNSSPSHSDICDMVNTLQERFDVHTRGIINPVRDISECRDHLKRSEYKLSKISKNLKTMITVVCVAFTLMVISYFFVRSSIENMIHDQMNEVKIEQKIDKELTDKLKILLEGIEGYEASETFTGE